MATKFLLNLIYHLSLTRTSTTAIAIALLEAPVNNYYTYYSTRISRLYPRLAMKVEELKGKPFEGLVNVTQLLKQPVGSNRSYHIDEILDEKDKGSIQGKVMLIHTGRGILVQGELTAEVELICSRCLASFLYLLNFTIEEEFLPTIDISSGLPLSSSEESVDFTIDSKNMLDLGEIIRQHVLLNLPMKPLCRPDCAGIKEISSYGST